MTDRISKPRKSLTATLGIAIAAALSPSGKIISSAVAAGAVVVSVTGYAIHEHKPPPHQIHASIAAPGTPAYLIDAGPLTTVYTDIESDGHEVHVLLTTGADASGSHGSAPSLWVTGWPIGGGDNPNKSFQRVGPTFGEPPSHPDAPDSPSQQPGFPPEAEIPSDPKPIEEIDCRQEKNKRLKVCDGKEKKSDDDETDKDASNPSTPPNTETAGTDNVGNHPLFKAPGEDTGTPSAQDHPQPNVVLLEKLLTEEFTGDDLIPSGETESNSSGGNGGPENKQAERKPITQDEDEHIQLQTLLVGPLALIPVSVPEPSLISLMLLGVAAMAWTGRRRTAPPKQTRV